MISIETEARVAKILLAIADGETCSEAVRQRLAHQIDFDPYNIFRMIDKSFNNYIDEYDILSFLK